MPTKPNMPTKRPASDLNLDLQVHSPAAIRYTTVHPRQTHPIKNKT